jgi:putative ABC transport system permease protein
LKDDGQFNQDKIRLFVSMKPILLRIGLRYSNQNLLQTILLILGVAIGVAVIVAVDLANKSASRSFQISADSITGRATHRITGGPSGLDEDIYRRLRLQLGLEKIAPVVEDYVTVIELNRRPMRLLGLDPFAEAPFRNYVANTDGALPVETLNTLLTQPNSVFLSEDVARSSGMTTDSKLSLEHGSRNIEVFIAGLLQPDDRISRQALSGIIITDISTAQETLGQIGRLSHIDLLIDTTLNSGKTEIEQIRRILPPGTSVERSESRSAVIEEIKSAFEFNLFALSLLSLVVAAFLIYNTVLFSTIKRRPTLGALRALGVTKGQIFGMIISETLILGVIGTLLGLGLGVILGKGLIHLVTQTINDLYFTLTVTGFSLSPLSFIKGAFIGISASFMAGLVPAWEATNIEPVGVLRRSEIENRVSRALPGVGIAGLTLCFLGFLTLFLPTRSVEISFFGLLAVLLGAAFLVPVSTRLLLRLLTPLSAKFAGVIGLMAPRNIIRSQSRTGVAIAALMVSVSVIISVDIMIGSFRNTVIDWLDNTLTADIFISAPSTGIGSNEGFDPSIGQDISGLPGILRIATARRVQIITPRYGPVNLVAVSDDISVNRRFIWAEGDVSKIWNEVEKGAVLVSEPFAYRNQIPPKPGTTIELPTDKGPRLFEVAGIYHDYTSQSGVVMMSDSTYRRFWNDNQITSIAAYVATGQNVDSIIKNLQDSFAGRHSLVVQSNQALRLSALDVFDRTFIITTALRLLVGIVAFIGVFSTLMALQLERAREIGVLRANGMSISQVWRMVILETGLIGLTAGLIALPVGTVLALILVHVINVRSFGWTIEFILRGEYFFAALAIAITAAVLAGIYPAIRFGRIRIASALRME